MNEDKWQSVYETGFEDGFKKASSIEVVFCKDCKWRHIEPYHTDEQGLTRWLVDDGCRWNEDEEPDDDDFCSYGEKRKNEDYA